jgi:hypothetical protein
MPSQPIMGVSWQKLHRIQCRQRVKMLSSSNCCKINCTHIIANEKKLLYVKKKLMSVVRFSDGKEDLTTRGLKLVITKCAILIGKKKL